MSDYTEEDLARAEDFNDQWRAMSEKTSRFRKNCDTGLAIFRAEARREALTPFLPLLGNFATPEEAIEQMARLKQAERQSEREACKRIVGEVAALWFSGGGNGRQLTALVDEICAALRRKRAK